uniref:Uncharacterized protein n=1 Tax=Heterorhabditis bacteriophora TaxID=37862 RepID=A0A1I7X8B7_HETBA
MHEKLKFSFESKCSRGHISLFSKNSQNLRTYGLYVEFRIYKYHLYDI